MPSIAAHLTIAKILSKKLEIDDPDFIRGNVLPDVINMPSEKSHHKIKGTTYLIPDTNYFKEKLDFDNPLDLGYYTHLLLDKYFLEKYIPKNIDDLTVFRTGKMYKEYDLLNYDMVKRFNINTERAKKILLNYEHEVDEEKLNNNIDYLLSKNTGETEYLEEETFMNFLIKISDKIYEEVLELQSE